MNKRVYNVLFLCTGNSARSILAEAILNDRGRGQFKAFSAGSHPKGTVHPMALALLEREGLPTVGLRSKAWDEFAKAGSPAMDFVFTVCDNAAGEVCPVWPGQPILAHWGVPDPAAVDGSELEQTKAFREAYRDLGRRIDFFLNIPIQSIDKMSLDKRVREIGTQ
ncbi:MAG TPA: arsenate reductase ArsC [Steroidobacteraceae bacterium]|nr:arsenate reductase ArsC [Steroidobacteraceae bacterium]